MQSQLVHVHSCHMFEFEGSRHAVVSAPHSGLPMISRLILQDDFSSLGGGSKIVKEERKG
eukprot:scaffold17248_cov28-Tisochrysis_lutea.AAC.1